MPIRACAILVFRCPPDGCPRGFTDHEWLYTDLDFPPLGQPIVVGKGFPVFYLCFLSFTPSEVFQPTVCSITSQQSSRSLNWQRTFRLGSPSSGTRGVETAWGRTRGRQTQLFYSHTHTQTLQKHARVARTRATLILPTHIILPVNLYSLHQLVRKKHVRTQK